MTFKCALREISLYELDGQQPTDCLSGMHPDAFHVFHSILLVFGENLKLVTDSPLFLE